MAVPFALVAGATSAWAGDKPLYEPAPAWVKEAPAPDPANLPADKPQLLISDQQHRIADGGVFAYVRSAVLIANAGMLNEAGTLRLEWLPDQGDLIVHHARILRAGETIDLLAKGERFAVIQRELGLERKMLTGMLTATMNAEGMRVGDVLDFAFTITRKDPVLGGQTSTSMPVLTKPVTAAFARNRLSWDKATPVALRSYFDGAELTPRNAGGFDEVELVGPLPKLPDLPDDMPLRLRPLPMVEASSFADWQAVSRTFAPLYATDGAIAPGSPLAAEVARIKAAGKTPRERAALALQSVQGEIRYLFKGMAGGNYTPQAATQTWSVRYGDCKAKTLLLLAMLRALDIEAEPVLASSDGGDYVPRRLPSAGAFDHVLVRAEIDGASLWLDGTGQGARLSDIDDTPPFRNVLPLRTAGAGLMSLPMRVPARPDVAIWLEIDQTAGIVLPAPYRLRMTMRGQGAEMMRMVTAQGTEDQREAMATQIANQNVGDGRVVSHRLSFDEAANTGSVEIEGIAPAGWGREEGRRYRTIDYAVNTIQFNPDRSRTVWKTIPVATGGPEKMSFTRRVLLPDGGKGYTIEGDRTLPPRLGGMNVTRSFSFDQGVANMEDVIGAAGSEIAPDAIAAERAALTAAERRTLKIMAPADLPRTHELRARAVREGRLKRLDALYAKAIADAEPGDATAYDARARLREGLGDWKGALADVERMVAIDPSGANLYFQAYILYVLGRDAESLAAIEKATAADPSDYNALTYHTARLADAKRHDEALAMIDARIAAGGDEREWATLHKAYLLATQGEIDAAAALADAALGEKPRDVGHLNQRCWLRGQMNVALEAALADCDRAIALGDNPAAALDSRALIHFRAGRLDAARADLEEALALEPDTAAALYLRGLVRQKQGDLKGGATDIADAQAIAPRIADDYTRWGITA
ncbi:DUF3857 domain-containing protein [Sphingomonas qomolangmaensis]|uniref:DUF3857 domain-containing protein n=1 Tax=Sphingomonas qomolangmaensis TaxID=2918765 RepID=A0ABY5LAH5_9SPHN|nr:DUF3857 domain-containing protein [Sphingomonas qomolangmaensis]UUL82815.1 DUF3857 domain-containing protein [Sphingomonas qomolangmaensis]